MEPLSPTSSVFLHAGKHLDLPPNQTPHPVPLLLTGNNEYRREYPPLVQNAWIVYICKQGGFDNHKALLEAVARPSWPCFHGLEARATSKRRLVA